MGIEAASAQMEEGADQQHQEEEKKASREEGKEGEQEEVNPEKQAKIEQAAKILESLMKKKADEPPDLAEKCMIF